MPATSQGARTAHGAEGRKLRVLHLVNWYPNVLAPGETPFVRRHIEALAPYCDNEVWHVEVRAGHRPRRTVRESLHAHRTFVRATPLKRWFVVEWMTTLMTLWLWWTRDRSKRYDLLNVHIAYPLLTHWPLLRRFIRLPVVITEHWTSYHFDFHTTSRGLERIRRIFGHGIPVISVSHALADDIERFARRGTLPMAVVDNVVEAGHFHHDPAVPPEAGRFFAIASWSRMKRADVLVRTLAELRARGREARLRMAGGGKGLDELRRTIAETGMEAHVDVLGPLAPAQVADEMRRAHALLHASRYETYSVVCAEALCCGTPVIASRFDCILEYLRPGMGLTVEGDDPRAWADAVEAFWDEALRVDKPALAAYMATRTNATSVGRRYHAVLSRVAASGGSLPAGRHQPHEAGWN